MNRPRPTTELIALWVVAGHLAAFAATPELPPLTASDKPRLPGKFVWADLVTDDVQAARKFYGHLFNWTFRDAGSYTIVANDDRPLCGMFQRARPKDKEAEPRWFGYISVKSVGGAQRAVTRSGGRVLAEAKKLRLRGEQAIFADPEGAVFGVIKSSSGDPEDFLAEPGDWIWIELLSRDARKAADFYREIAGYEVVENTGSNRLSDYVLVSEGYARATTRTLSSANKQVQPTWLPFVRVRDVHGSVALAKELRGKVLLAPKSELFDAKLAVIADPTGAAIGIMEWPEQGIKGAR